MSTKAQIRIVECGKAASERLMAEGRNYDGIFTVFRRYDSFIDKVIRDLKKSYRASKNGRDADKAGDVASYICAVDPGRFVPLKHDDIWVGSNFYVLKVYHQGPNADALWNVSIYTGPRRVIPSEDLAIGDKFNLQDLKLLCPETDLRKLNSKIAREITDILDKP